MAHLKVKIAAALALGMTTFFGSASAQAQTLRPIMIENNCYREIRLWVTHADGWRNWHGHGAYLFSAYEPAIALSDRGTRLMQRDDHNLYFYAEATDGSGVYWGGDYPNTVNGTTYRMRQAEYSIERGAFVVQINCNR